MMQDRRKVQPYLMKRAVCATVSTQNQRGPLWHRQLEATGVSPCSTAFRLYKAQPRVDGVTENRFEYRLLKQADWRIAGFRSRHWIIADLKSRRLHDAKIATSAERPRILGGCAHQHPRRKRPRQTAQ